ncbi:magnesium chelatase subunit D family protein [Dyadobacter bucti]|uniref:magnesium chelatase subunit D family protein n=1 Tax=Dyadobacter bucti TaxID=2572203 RepID=UPI001E586B31|nr:magnesium chelatase subunit D family protein [Dyadobacter bucti]
MYPFTAIVGQERLKQALLLCAVNPGIGGVLIKGEKGTAKSTAARGLSEVMPVIQRVKDSVFNISGGEFLVSNPAEMDFETEEMAVPFVDLPLGASEDRVLGSLDLEAIISEKKKKLQPGLLAAAHRGILYIDEVNLLPDHLVDILLDVSASGINTVQREGLSVSHASRFVLIGTMNPEEGNLRPQFLDRFGLMVEVGAQQDVKERTEVVRRRMAFEADPVGFNNKWNVSQEALTTQIRRAQQLLPSVEMPDGLLTLISQVCIEWSVASLRADIVMYKTAITLAAWSGRAKVNAEDIKQAASLVLLHRRGRHPQPPNPGIHPGAEASEGKKPETDEGSHPNPGIHPGAEASEGKKPETDEGSDPNPGIYPGAEASEGKKPETDEGSDPNPGIHPGAQEYGEEACTPDTSPSVFAAAPGQQLPNLQSESPVSASEWANGRRSKAVNTPKGFQIRAEKDSLAKDIAITETLTHAIFRNPDDILIRKDDLHQKIRSGKIGHLILFVVDASGSMAAGKRMEAVKGSVLSLLKDAYQKRDMVGVISFRGVEAEILLEPTSSIDLAESAMENLPTGGRTPLAHAMQLAQRILKQYPNRQQIQPWLIVLSDGKANVPLAGGGDPWQHTLELASAIAGSGIQSLVLDTEKGYLRFGRAAELAAALGAECLSLEEFSASSITDTIWSKIS